MVRARPLLGQQEEHEVDRPFVDRVEIDGAVEPDEQAAEPVEIRDLAVRNRDSLADPGGSQPFALEQDAEHRALVEAGHLGGPPGDFLDHLFLARGRQAVDHPVAGQQVADFHPSLSADRIRPRPRPTGRASRDSRRRGDRSR